jgi:hypothetical protein
MTVIELRDAIVAAFLAQLSPQECQVRGGKASLQDLQRLATKATKGPAILVTVLAGDAGIQGGMAVANTEFAAYVVTRDLVTPTTPPAAPIPPVSRHDVAINFWSAIEQIVATTRWGDGVSLATDVHAEGMYTPELDSTGLALWAVTWRHKVDLPPDETAANIQAFNTLSATITTPPTTNAEGQSYGATVQVDETEPS